MMDMYYLALLFGREDNSAPGPDTSEFAAEVERYAEFEARASRAVAGGYALSPSAPAVHIRRPKDRTLVSDGPFPEQAEVVGGFYVFDCANLDEAIHLA